MLAKLYKFFFEKHNIRRDTLRILNSSKIHPANNFTQQDKINLGLRFAKNAERVMTGTPYQVQLAMALKLLELDPEEKGDVAEFGTWKGGVAINLSILCKRLGRKLLIYDSFQGLPAAKPGDRQAAGYAKGEFSGSLDEVKNNIRTFGEIDVCEFYPGWFESTLPSLHRPLVLSYLDVDIEDSLNTCVKYVWPNLTEHGYLFTDEAVGVDYTALFFSERWWKENFNRTPPGMIGAGTGLPIGNIYIGPQPDLISHPGQRPSTGSYTRKDYSGFWSYYPN